MTFDELRIANQSRQVLWPGSDRIDLAFRGLELVGEVGELANKLKKLMRLRLGILGTLESEADLIEEIEAEIGDVAICLDLLCSQLGINLSDAIREKFNRTSFKHGFPTRIGEFDAQAEVARMGPDNVIRKLAARRSVDDMQRLCRAIYGHEDFPRPILEWWPLSKRMALAEALIQYRNVPAEEPNDGEG